MEIDVPRTYDFRKEYPGCVQEPMDIATTGKNCSSSYAFATISAVQDRICMQSKEKV